jgi:hypothetical protein
MALALLRLTLLKARPALKARVPLGSTTRLCIAANQGLIVKLT